MSWADVLGFHHLHDPVLAADGSAVAWETRPGHGDGGAVIVRRRGQDLSFGPEHRVDGGSRPALSADGHWLACRVSQDGQPAGMARLDLTASASVRTEPDVARFAFSYGGGLLVWQHGASLDRRLCVLRLGDGKRTTRFDVERFAVAPRHDRIAWAEADPAGLRLRWMTASGALGELRLDQADSCSQLTWSDAGQLLALVGRKSKAGRLTPTTVQLHGLELFEESPAEIDTHLQITPADLPERHRIASDVAPRADGLGGVWFGMRFESQPAKPGGETSKRPAKDSPEALRESAEVIVWHQDDDRIAPHRARTRSRLQRRALWARHDSGDGNVVQIGTTEAPDIRFPGPDARYVLAANSDRFAKEQTWDGSYRDIWLVDVTTGAKRRILEHFAGNVSIAPDGSCVVYWQEGQWWLLDSSATTAAARNLTADCGVSFGQLGWDYPRPDPGAGLAGFGTSPAVAVLLYDRAGDLWSFPARGGAGQNLTGGRGARLQIRHRVLDRDPSDPWVHGSGDDPLLLELYGERSKWGGFASLQPATNAPALDVHAWGPQRYRLSAQARDSGHLLYTVESYDRYPDLHVAGPDLEGSQQVSDLDAQREPFAWGSSSVLSYDGPDGKPMEAGVIVPEGWKPGDPPLPVLIYYYRNFAQRAYEWKPVLVNHRPCFAYYASHGYAIFLPDIRFEVGHPGPSAVECLDRGVDALIAAGVADADRICLHGHSWSGYQTAFAVTRTDRYRCAIAGAPVSNMTSAYSGIRLSSGLARQFQYERTQSRIGKDLWEGHDLYIENSPVFFANRIETPLLILFGDVDGAVPWQQGIELHLALRRLGKDCQLLQYEDEPHHPGKLGNRLDWAMKMQEYVDFHLKGTDRPSWLEPTRAPTAGAVDNSR